MFASRPYGYGMGLVVLQLFGIWYATISINLKFCVTATDVLGGPRWSPKPSYEFPLDCLAGLSHLEKSHLGDLLWEPTIVKPLSRAI